MNSNNSSFVIESNIDIAPLLLAFDQFHEALKIEGCIGARMTGAGFGGCAIAIVDKSLVNRFCTYVGRKYETDQNRKADFYLVKPVDGVSRIK